MLSLTNLKKTFYPGTLNEKVAINELSLYLERGDFLTLIGSNGAGKSTLFNLISGAQTVDSGKIVLDGQNITYEKEYKRSENIGQMFQNPLRGTAPHMSIEENLALAYLRSSKKSNPFRMVGTKTRELFQERLAELELGLEDRMKSPVGLLSGGQRQALTLLMSVLNTPKLLLLDEHTAALDPGTAEKVLSLTKSIVAQKNITCIMITHNIASALSMGNRTILMDSGQIVLDLSGEKRDNMSVEQLLEAFRSGTGKNLDNDRMLLNKE